MKKIIILFFLIFLIGSTNSQDVKPDIKIISNTYHNWIIGWGVDFTINLINNGDATAKNITLKINYTISNDTYTKEEKSKLIWGEDVIPTSESTKVFTIKLPKGFKVILASVKIQSQ